MAGEQILDEFRPISTVNTTVDVHFLDYTSFDFFFELQVNASFLTIKWQLPSSAGLKSAWWKRTSTRGQLGVGAPKTPIGFAVTHSSLTHCQFSSLFNTKSPS